MDLLNSFYYEWFDHPEWWFSKKQEYDEYISSKYSELLGICYVENYWSFKRLILMYDQLPRHIYRNEYANHIILYYLDKAVDIVNRWINTAHFNVLTTIEWTFFLMPLRHTNEMSNMCRVMKEIWIRMGWDVYEREIVKRFLKATCNRFLRDNQNQRHFIEEFNSSNETITFDMSILHFSPMYYIKPIESKTTIKFNSNVIDKTKPIIVSLSGGVDSMVSSFVLKKLFPSANIQALHICYDNRCECGQEILFLKHWCHHLGIKLYIRKIAEIHRKPCMEYELRDLYETYTRNVRYNCYKSITNDINPQVIMAHNKDDCLENIMTNIAHKNKYDNLQGMTAVSIQDDIMFMRPFLDTTKEDIIQFAHHNNIPYLPNSTPTWSQRGQIRNDIVPVLDKWNDKFVPSLYHLSDNLSSFYKIMQVSLSQFIRKGVFNDTMNIFTINEISLSDIVNEDIYWKELFNKLYNVYPSTKAIQNLVYVMSVCKASLKPFENSKKRKVMITKNIVFEIVHKSMNNVKINIYKV